MTCENMRLTELLRGELEPPETQIVLSHLEGCRTCRERIRVMAVLETRFKHEPVAKKGQRWPYLAAAAAALVLGLIPAVYQFRGELAWMDSARISAAAPYPYFPLELRSEEPDPGNGGLRESAFDAYVAGDYLKANTILKEIVAEEEDPELIFFLGVTDYLLGNPEPAMAHLRLSAADPRWKAPSQWYMANLLLREGDSDSAISFLEGLRDQGGEFSEESAGLLRVLRP